MHRIIRRTHLTLPSKALAAVTAAILFTGANAAGLGKLTVLSSLGQPLRAEVELNSVAKDEVGTLVAKLASTQAFKQANVEFNPALMSVRFTVEQRGSQQVIRITSSQPINEPYVGMLLELASSQGRLVREYTFLLDPAELRHSPSASIAAPVAVTALPSQRDVLPQKQVAMADEVKQVAVADKVKPVDSKPKPSPDIKTSEDKSKYRIRTGDTLGAIARQHKPDEVSLDQMLVSLYRANPDAFMGNNMNRLKSGRIMAIPDAATAGSISGSEARKVIIAQSSDFNQYREKLAGMVAQAPSQQSGQPAQDAGGKITAKVEEQPTAVSKSVDRLKLSKENAGTGDKAAGIVSTEDKLSQDKSVADAQTRIRELEKNIQDLQGLLDLKSKDMATQQKQADLAASAKAALPAAPIVAAAAPSAAVAAASQPTVVADQPKPAVVPPAAPAVAKPKPKLAPPPPPMPEPGFLDDLLSNQKLLAAIAAAVLGLGYLVWNKGRRKKKAQELTDKYLADPLADAPNSLFGSTGGQSINTNNSIFNSSFTPSASQLDANEVDPVAEADVYIAYGRDAQAIEILKDALRAQPERNAVRVKLLEVYAAQNDVMSFDAVASDLYALTKGEGEDWVYAAKLGSSIDPKNPLYTDNNDLLEEMADKPASLHSLTNPVAELDPDSLMASTRMPVSSVPVASPVNHKNEQVVAQAASPDLPLDFWLDAEPLKKESAFVMPDAQTREEQQVAVMTDQETVVDKVEVHATPAEMPALEENKNAVQEFEKMLDFYTKQDKPAEQASAGFDRVEQMVAMPIEELTAQPVAEPSPLSEEILYQPAAEPMVSTLSDMPDMLPIKTTLTELKAENQPADPAVLQFDPAPIEFDFSSINLDLSSTSSSLSDYKSPAPGGSSSVVNLEMATKLDLAVAYLEIGDKEGARELLDEVVKGGMSEQITKAKEALSKLS